jgi:hypothetical protein
VAEQVTAAEDVLEKSEENLDLPIMIPPKLTL